MDIFVVPLIILALAFLFNGFPDINIGNKTIKKYYNKKEKDTDND